ncbi:MAG: ribosomal protein S18-alanine N-acetyltransferase [Alicyclobacillaceae bacterium]|jgi:ribosomal-protein-alanine N-acetyltransferase|uniref:ribosomal protein S18-alanine N-acetyltransferase n=1 Tax=Alicyclobacillus sp. SP_1 TaxID=2942475 RepID=UPI0021588FAB|nr:ribosomal protein S18-alanine N-acetyltransferase [Alicyclobacillus sp. SP_1]MCY0887950.1 ribosomal protein S18-alanine N-acetyltransferase [Alicyclobacillaceae bacterium]MCY0895916.1 ribosomal protein S18-alanine N-acetyltransferase [Alicyclobacillaceae bacterium]
MQSNWNPEELKIRHMVLADVDDVMKVERRSFTAPWSRQAFVTELADNQFARYLVLEYSGRVIGYGGVWLIIDEGHVTNVAVDPDFRGKQLGEQMMRALMSLCTLQGARKMTLEVRVTNVVAQRLYEKLGFETVGVRKGYYTDNQEDAYIMWVDLPELNQEAFAE